jgi:hypothetical protein
MKQLHAGRIACCVLLLCAGMASFAAPPDGTSPDTKDAAQPAPSERKYVTETVRGKVVWLDEALARIYGVTTEPAAERTSVVLEMADGRLWPLVPDTRGRAFQLDERLRDIELELLVRRYAGVPMLQAIRVAAVKPDGLYEIDYWCDICAIPMFILKPCECCQGPTRLREQRIVPNEAAAKP